MVVPSTYTATMVAIRNLVRHRYKAGPLNHPWTVALAWHAGLCIVTVGAVVQRGPGLFGWALQAGLLGLFPGAYFMATGRILPARLLVPTELIATAILLYLRPVPFDIAPLILVVGLGGVAVQASVRAATVSAVAFTAFMTLARVSHHVEGVAMYLCLMVLAWLVGYMLSVQRQLLRMERQAQQNLRSNAASEERRRIARDVHDVIAHSLSVTLLHLTGARRGLQEDRDIDEAIAALIDAERLGRQAMSDIRRTVGLLAVGSPPTAAEPTLDVVNLVRDVERAGVAIDYHIDGQPPTVPAAVRLAVYRIIQESLTNVVKHAAGTRAHLCVRISSTTIALWVSNDLPRRLSTADVDAYSDAASGAGLRGMRQRAESLGGWLRAGIDGSQWKVLAEIPLTTTKFHCDDCQLRS